MRKLQLILGYSSTGKTALTFSGQFKDYIFTPFHHLRIASNSEGIKDERYQRFTEIIFTAVKNAEYWRCVPEKEFSKMFRVVMDPCGLKSGKLNQILFAKNLLRFFTVMKDRNVLIEGELVTKQDIFNLVVSAARSHFAEIDVILLTRKWNKAVPLSIERRGKERGIDKKSYAKFYERLEKMLTSMFEKGVISSLKIGSLNEPWKVHLTMEKK